MKRLALVACAALVAGCSGRKTAALRGPTEGRPATLGARWGVAVIADERDTNREAARALAAPLAAECSAEPLGAAGSMDECLAVACERGVDRVVTCRVVEYDPYDPARLVVRVAVGSAARRPGVSPADAMTLGRTAVGAARGPGAGSGSPAKTVRIDLRSTGSWFASYASACGLGDSPEDLLEAEILLRDPVRFFPFAARHIAAEALAAAAAPEGSSRDSASVPSPEPAPRALGVLGHLR